MLAANHFQEKSHFQHLLKVLFLLKIK